MPSAHPSNWRCFGLDDSSELEAEDFEKVLPGMGRASVLMIPASLRRLCLSLLSSCAALLRS